MQPSKFPGPGLLGFTNGHSNMLIRNGDMLIVCQAIYANGSPQHEEIEGTQSP